MLKSNFGTLSNKNESTQLGSSLDGKIENILMNNVVQGIFQFFLMAKQGIFR